MEQKKKEKRKKKEKSIESILKLLKRKYFLFQSCKNKQNKNITFSPYPLNKTRKGCCCQYLKT